jgi:hypothetical protein
MYPYYIVLEPDKSSLTPSISPEFYSWIGRGGPSNLVSEPGGLEFEPQPRIPLRVIPAYRSPYGGARIAQTSGPHMPERQGRTQ